jgi:hypothetical protein
LLAATIYQGNPDRKTQSLKDFINWVGDYSSHFIYPIELEINLKNTTNTARSASHLDP